MTRELGELLEDRPRGSGVNASMLRLPGNESLRLIRREWVIRRDEIPRPFDGLRILHISDLHFAPWYPRSFFERVSRAALDFGEPDLVLFTGDLVDDESTLDWLDTTLATLDARLGRFAILGNHDMKHRPGRVRRALRNAGYSVIDGKWARLSVDKATLAIGGTSAPWGPSLDLDEAPAADFRIVLSHTPDLFREFVGAGVELVFAGHTHGGQIRVPVLGPIVLPSRYGRRFDRGFFESGGTLMYVSQGVGGNHPIRFGCPPEISLMTLLAASGSESRRMHSSQRGEIRDSR